MSMCICECACVCVHAQAALPGEDRDTSHTWVATGGGGWCWHGAALREVSVSPRHWLLVGVPTCLKVLWLQKPSPVASIRSLPSILAAWGGILGSRVSPSCHPL